MPLQTLYNAQVVNTDKPFFILFFKMKMNTHNNMFGFSYNFPFGRPGYVRQGLRH